MVYHGRKRKPGVPRLTDPRELARWNGDENDIELVEEGSRGKLAEQDGRKVTNNTEEGCWFGAAKEEHRSV